MDNLWRKKNEKIFVFGPFWHWFPYNIEKASWYIWFFPLEKMINTHAKESLILFDSCPFKKCSFIKASYRKNCMIIYSIVWLPFCNWLLCVLWVCSFLFYFDTSLSIQWDLFCSWWFPSVVCWSWCDISFSHHSREKKCDASRIGLFFNLIQSFWYNCILISFKDNSWQEKMEFFSSKVTKSFLFLSFRVWLWIWLIELHEISRFVIVLYFFRFHNHFRTPY